MSHNFPCIALKKENYHSNLLYKQNYTRWNILYGKHLQKDESDATDCQNFYFMNICKKKTRICYFMYH